MSGFEKTAARDRRPVTLRRRKAGHLSRQTRVLPLWVTRLICALALLALAFTVDAHDPGLSALTVRFEKERIVAHLSLAGGDAKWVHPSLANPDAYASPTRSEAALQALTEFALTAVEMKVDGRAISPVEVLPTPAAAHHDLEIGVSFPRVPGSYFEVRSAAFASLPRGHRQFVTVLDGRQQPVTQRILDASHPSVTWKIQSHPPGRGLLEYLKLGVEFIATFGNQLVFALAFLVAVGLLPLAIRCVATRRTPAPGSVIISESSDRRTDCSRPPA